MSYEIAGRSVERVGFGAMQLPGPGVMGPPRDHDEAVAVLRRAVEAGVNHIDTAQFYGPDVANELIREALHPYPDELVLVSKVGAVRDAEGGWPPAQRPDQLRAGVEDNLRTLGVERLGAVNLRLMDHPVPPEQQVPMADQLGELVALREEGKIGGIGVSTATAEQVQEAVELARITCVQNAYSLLSRGDEPVLQLCRAAGIAYVPYFPLGAAFPGIPKVREDARVQAVAERLGHTPAQVGLAWLLAHAENVLLIPGTSSLVHLEENLAVADITLDADTLADLDAIAS